MASVSYVATRLKFEHQGTGYVQVCMLQEVQMIATDQKGALTGVDISLSTAY